MTAPRVLGVDVGGTFTDFVSWNGTVLEAGKVSSTPDDQSRAVIEGATALAATPDRLIHGTTVATNALLERRGAKTALVTTEGFEDVIEIGRQDRPSLYDPFADRPDPLVPAERRVGVGRDGTIGADFADRIGDAEAVAVSLLYGFEMESIERAVADEVAKLRPNALVSLSSSVVPEFREYERTATTVVNAFLAPETSRYLGHLAKRAGAAGLPEDIAVMRSSGGLISIDEARALPASILLSGPAGGVVAAAALGTAMGRHTVISFDMGGTSTDVCRIEGGRPEVTYERTVADFPCRMPAVAIHTVGAGGGSVGWIDEGGSLRVGPRSAGARPGPACYGRGGIEPAVTDADLCLGRIGGTLAGGLALDHDAAIAALATVGEALGLDVDAVAAGIVTIVEEVMAGAIRRVSVEEGADPRGATLVAFGGAGGLHASSLARSLGMASAVVAPYAGVFSAVGLLLSPPRVDVARGTLLTEVGATAIDRLGDELEAAALGRLGRPDEAAVSRLVDARYMGQSHELTLPLEPGAGWGHLTARFHEAHLDRNGFAMETDPIEVVAVRAEAVGRPVLRWEDLPEHRPAGAARIGVRQVPVEGEVVEVTVWRREGLMPGAVVAGPAVVAEAEATTWVGKGEQATIHDTGALEIEW